MLHKNYTTLWEIQSSQAFSWADQTGQSLEVYPERDLTLSSVQGRITFEDLFENYRSNVKLHKHNSNYPLDLHNWRKGEVFDQKVLQIIDKYGLEVSHVEQVCASKYLVEILNFKEAKDFFLSVKEEHFLFNLGSISKLYFKRILELKTESKVILMLEVMLDKFNSLNFRERLTFDQSVKTLLDKYSDNAQILDLCQTAKRRIEDIVPIVESRKTQVLDIMIQEKLDTFHELLSAHPNVLSKEYLGTFFYLIMVRHYDYNLQNLTERLKTEKICLAAVQQNGKALFYIPEHLKTEKICLAAVQQNGKALLSVPEHLKTREICLAAVKQNMRIFSDQ